MVEIVTCIAGYHEVRAGGLVANTAGSDMERRGDLEVRVAIEEI